MQKLVQQRMKMLETLPKILGPVSVKISDVHTGAWRYRRPVIIDDTCIHCGICAEYCPCGVIEKQSGQNGHQLYLLQRVGICTVECPKKAIDFVLEADCEKEGM